MAETIDINTAAALINAAEEHALRTTKVLLDTLVADLEALEATLPTTMPTDAARVINDVKGTLGYVRSATLPQALYRFEPILTSMMPPPIVDYQAPVAPNTGEAIDGETVS